MIDELAINDILVRIPLADFDNIEKYIRFIKNLQDKDVLVCILQDREHIEEKYLTEQRLDYIFSNLSNEVNTFQIGNSINRKKWAFVSIDEYFSFFKIAYDLKNDNFQILNYLEVILLILIFLFLLDQFFTSNLSFMTALRHSFT